MRRTLTRIFVGVALLLAAAAVGYAVAERLAPERLRAEAEEFLGRAIGAPVTVGGVRLNLGLGIRLEAHAISVWPGPAGVGLYVESLAAGVRPLALLAGKLQLGWMVLDGARLRIERGADGRWTPAPFAALAAEEPEARHPPHPDELLSPLIVLEGAVRSVLAKPFLADTLQLRDAGLAFVDALARGGGPRDRAALTLALEDIQAQIRHRRALGDAMLSVRARLADADGACGALAGKGRRTRGGAMSITAAATALELAAVAPYVPAIHPQARLEGRLSGFATFETAAPGEGRLEINLEVDDLRSSVPPRPATPLGLIQADRARAEAVLAITPQRVHLHDARITSGNLDLRMNGMVERPMHPGSVARLELAFRDLELARARDLLAWLPALEREEAVAIATPMEAGRIVTLSARGAAPLSGWQGLFAGRTERLPAGFTVDGEVADLFIRVGDTDRLEGVKGRVLWSGDRLEVREARGTLNGSPLPALTVTLDGVSSLFASDASRRALSSGALPLLGLSPLWKVLKADSEGEPAEMPTTVRLEIDTFEHPMFLWPIEDLRAVIEPADRGVHIEVERATLAGVPVHGDGDWLFEPDEELLVRLEAGPPESSPKPNPAAAGWAQGCFSAGQLPEGTWRQKASRGCFSADGGKLQLHRVEVDLEPSGRLFASGTLDLAQPDAVPFELDFSLTEGDVAALIEQSGLPPEVATGRVDLSGHFEGSLQPEVSLLDTLSGRLSITAREGEIRRALPPVVAVALASDAFNPFSRRESVRYDRVETSLEFSEGLMGTDSFSLDGPDMRVFASGHVDIARSPHPVDAQVALFLFRQIERAVEKIPIINLLLLGSDENLAAAYFELSGPWEDPEAKLIPLRSLGAGPASLVLQGVPSVVLKGIEVIQSMLGTKRKGEPDPDPPQPQLPRES